MIEPFIEGLHPAENAHEMVDLDAELQLLKQEFKPIDVSDFLNVCLQADVNSEDWRHVLHGVVVMFNILTRALGLQDYWE